MLMFGSLRASGHRKCSCLLVARSQYSICLLVARSSSTSSSSHNPPSVSLDFHRDASLAILTLCNAQRRNALTYSMMHQLDAHVNTLHEWSRDISQNNARVLILTGSGGSFCAGLDIKQDDDNDVLQDGREMTQHMSRVTNCIHALPVLSVTAIDGNAIGGGAELSTCTDLVVLSRQSTIKFVHASRGASPGWGGGRRLQKRVGRRKALRMLLLGESVFGEEEAEQLDYADCVAEEGESSLDAAMRLVVDPILNLPCSQSVRAIKRVVSVADGDEDVIDTASGRLRYVATDATDDDSMTKEYNNTAVKSEIDAFLQVWGGSVVQVCYGGIFAASTANIFKQDMRVWKTIEKALERGDNIQEGHYMERSWGILLATLLKAFQIEALKNHSTKVRTETCCIHGSLLRGGKEADDDDEEYGDDEDDGEQQQIKEEEKLSGGNWEVFHFYVLAGIGVISAVSVIAFFLSIGTTGRQRGLPLARRH